MSSKKSLPSVEYLRQALEYCEITGDFTWKVRPAHHFIDGKYPKERIAKAWNAQYAGRNAGTTTRKYSQIKIDNKMYEAHRVAFYMVNGVLPDEVDHIDNNKIKCNNGISNLRNSTKSLNHANRSIQRNNTSGYKGVSWHKSHKKWAAYIRVDGKRIGLGSYDDPKIAYDAYRDAAKKYFGEYARFK